MDTKKWFGIIIVVVFGIAFMRMNSSSQTRNPELQMVSAGSTIPAPAPGQKKVVLKNLRMA
jgi:hypothetical protein